MPTKDTTNVPAMFMKISDTGEIREYINTNRAVLLYFAHEQCNVCKALKPKLEEALNETYPDIQIVLVDTTTNPLIAAEFQVNSVPVVLLFLEGREFIRKTRIFSVKEIIDQIERPYRLMIE